MNEALLFLSGLISVAFVLTAWKVGKERLYSTIIGSGTTEELDAALSLAFGPLLRLTFASLFAYTLSQSCNVYLYVYLKERLQGAHLWLRANTTNILAQLLDSTVFFLIAFWGIVPLAGVWEVLVTGFVIKIVFMMLASPLLYLNRVEEDDGEGQAVIAIR